MPDLTEFAIIAEALAELYDFLEAEAPSTPVVERVLDGLFDAIERIEQLEGVVGHRARAVLGPTDLDC